MSDHLFTDIALVVVNVALLIANVAISHRVSNLHKRVLGLETLAFVQEEHEANLEKIRNYKLKERSPE